MELCVCGRFGLLVLACSGLDAVHTKRPEETRAYYILTMFRCLTCCCTHNTCLPAPTARFLRLRATKSSRPRTQQQHPSRPSPAFLLRYIHATRLKLALRVFVELTALVVGQRRGSGSLWGNSQRAAGASVVASYGQSSAPWGQGAAAAPSSVPVSARRHAPGGKTSWSPYGHMGQVCPPLAARACVCACCAIAM